MHCYGNADTHPLHLSHPRRRVSRLPTVMNAPEKISQLLAHVFATKYSQSEIPSQTVGITQVFLPMLRVTSAVIPNMAVQFFP